jgi:hypothetical protein
MIGGLFSGPGDAELDPRNQAINLFGAAMLSGAGSGQNFSSILGNAVAQGQGAYGRAMDAKSKRDYMQSLMADQQAQAEQRRAAVAELQRKTSAADELARAQRAFWAKAGGMGGGGMPGAPAAPQPMGFRDANIAMTGNAPPGYTPPQQQQGMAGGMGGGISPAMFAEAQMLGINPETLKSMAEAQDWGRATVARLAQTRDGQGRPVQQQLDQFGRPVGSPLAAEYKPQMVNQGDRQTLVDLNSARDGQSFTMNMSPGERDASARGWAGVRQAADRFAFDKSQVGAGGGFTLQTTPTGIVAVPKDAPGTGPIVSRPVVDGSGLPVGGNRDTTAQQRATEAKEALALIQQAEDIIPKATGSYAGRGIDLAARAFGKTNEGANNAARLQALEGALVAKMPKMSGPQSDKDVMLYRQMAGQIGDPTLPAEAKMAALQTIKEIQQRYAGDAPMPSPAAPMQPPAPAAAAQPANAPKPKSRVVTLDDGTSVGAELGSDGNYYVMRGGKRYRVEE